MDAVVKREMNRQLNLITHSMYLVHQTLNLFLFIAPMPTIESDGSLSSDADSITVLGTTHPDLDVLLDHNGLVIVIGRSSQWCRLPASF